MFLKLRQMIENQEFDYYESVAELERIALKVENPSTALEDIEALIKRSDSLIAACRDYLRTMREKTEQL